MVRKQVRLIPIWKCFQIHNFKALEDSKANERIIPRETAKPKLIPFSDRYFFLLPVIVATYYFIDSRIQFSPILNIFSLILTLHSLVSTQLSYLKLTILMQSFRQWPQYTKAFDWQIRFQTINRHWYKLKKADGFEGTINVLREMDWSSHSSPYATRVVH